MGVSTSKEILSKRKEIQRDFGINICRILDSQIDNLFKNKLMDLVIIHSRYCSIYFASTEFRIFFCFYSVSYTHLDVYKRQIENSNVIENVVSEIDILKINEESTDEVVECDNEMLRCVYVCV